MAFIDDILSVIGSGRVTSGFRTQAEQDALIARGATSTRRSSHSTGTADRPGAIDVAGVTKSASEVQQALVDAGFGGARVISESGKGRNQGTGQHYHISFHESQNNQPPASEQVTPEERAAMAQPRDYEIVDPFAVGDSLKKQNQTVVDRANAADQILSESIAAIDAIQPQREMLLQQSVDAKKSINDEVQRETQGLIDRARPIFQKRAAIAERQAQLATMNPLERAVKSVFSLNHNSEHLQRVDKELAGALSSMGQDYQYMTGLQDRLSQVIDANYRGDDSVLMLQAQNADEDARHGMQLLGSAQQVFSAELDGLRGQTQLMQAQAQARADTIAGLTDSQALAAQAEAKKNGGIATVNGVPIRLGELDDLVESNKEKEYLLKSRQLALQSAQQNMADEAEQRLISHMTKPEIEAAVNNGGVYKGQRLNQTLLTQAYGNHLARAEAMLNQPNMADSVQTTQQLIKGIQSKVIGTNTRMRSMFGHVTQEQGNYVNDVAVKINGMAAQLNDANARGLGAEWMQKNGPILASMIQKQNELIDRTAERWAGGNKELKAVGYAWLTGEPLSSPAAIKGLITMARNGMPAGTNLRGPAAESFRRIQQMVTSFDSAKPGTSMEQMLQRGAKKDDTPLIAQIQSEISNGYNSYLMDSVLQSTPAIARSITGVDGAAHPFSRVKPEDFAAAVQTGDALGYERIATNLGITPAEAKALFDGGAGGQAAIEMRKKNPKFDYNQVGQQLQALQMQGMFQALDASSSATDSFKPSKALVDLLGNSQYQQRVTQLASLSGQRSFGDFMVSQIGGGNFGQAFYQYSESAKMGYSTLQTATLKARIKDASRGYGDPYTRAAMVLAAVPTLNPNEEQALLQAVRGVVGQMPSPEQELWRYGSGTEAASAQAGYETGTYNKVRNVILNHKFDNPALEKVRQKAAAAYQGMDEAVTRINGVR